jgi:hypothetical protein
MRRPQFVAAALWLFFLADGVRQGLAVAVEPFFGSLGFDGLGLAAIALPAVFFTVAPLLLKGHPFDATLVRQWVNAKYGPETYESYTRAIRPLALFSAVGFVIGATALLSTVFGRSSGQGSFVLSGFFLSAGIGFMACRTILRRQGNTIE